MNWSDLQHHPHLTVDANAERYIVFVIHSWQVKRIEVDAKTLECKELETWFCDRPMPEPPAAWVADFWTRLRAAPSEILNENQWISSYRTRMDGKIYLWEQDRKECTDSLLAVQLDDGN